MSWNQSKVRQGVCSVCVRRRASLKAFRKVREDFSRDDIGGIRYRQRPALRDDVGGCVWPPHPRAAGALKRGDEGQYCHFEEKVIE